MKIYSPFLPQKNLILKRSSDYASVNLFFFDVDSLLVLTKDLVNSITNELKSY